MEVLNTRVKLSTLWIVVMLNIVFADILSIFIELENKNTLNDIIGEIKTTMAIAAVLINIPILMIHISRSSSYKINRILNIIAGFITLQFIIFGGSLMPHYIICATMEVVALILIIRLAWKWEIEEEKQPFKQKD